jgi:hypothetical protein
MGVNNYLVAKAAVDRTVLGIAASTQGSGGLTAFMNGPPPAAGGTTGGFVIYQGGTSASPLFLWKEVHRELVTQEWWVFVPTVAGTVPLVVVLEVIEWDVPDSPDGVFIGQAADLVAGTDAVGPETRSQYLGRLLRQAREAFNGVQG